MLDLPVLPNPHDNLTREEISSFAKYYSIEGVFTPEECNELKFLGEELVKQAVKKHTQSNIMDMHHCFLPADHPIHEKMKPLWLEAAKHFDFSISYVEPYKLQLYREGGFFDRHIDNYHGLNMPDDRKITAIVQLSDETEYDGGDLMIGFHTAKKKQGTLIFFPSFYPHNVKKVTKGTRWAVVAWAWGPYWK